MCIIILISSYSISCNQVNEFAKRAFVHSEDIRTQTQFYNTHRTAEKETQVFGMCVITNCIDFLVFTSCVIMLCPVLCRDMAIYANYDAD